MAQIKKAAPVPVWWVRHPDHEVAIVRAPNWEQATVEAASGGTCPGGRWPPYVSLRRKNWLRGASARSAGSGSTARRCCAPGAPSRPGTGS